MKPRLLAPALCVAVLTAGALVYRFDPFGFRARVPAQSDIHRDSPAAHPSMSTGLDASALRPPAPYSGASRVSIARAARDRAYLHGLLDTYSAEQDQEKKIAALLILGAVANQEILQFAVGMTRSETPQTRKDGFRLLKSYSLEDGQVRNLVLAHLRDERDVETVRELLRMLVPAMMPVEEASVVIEQLEAFSMHRDAAVRSESVRQLVQWRRGEEIDEDLYRALQDPDGEVRLAAMEGVWLSRTQDERLKDILLAIGSDAQADIGERRAALEALRGFWLVRSEYSVYAQIKSGIGEDAGAAE